MKTGLSALIACCLFIVGCSSQEEEPSNGINILEPADELVSEVALGKPDISWLVGNWRDTSTFSFQKTQIIENWTENNGVFTASGLKIKNASDTTLGETMLINLNLDTVSFDVTVLDQNNGQMISFKLNSFSEDSVQFVNFSHEFPQQIIYKRINSDSIHGIAAGFVFGNMRRTTTKLSRYH